MVAIARHIAANALLQASEGCNSPRQIRPMSEMSRFMKLHEPQSRNQIMAAMAVIRPIGADRAIFMALLRATDGSVCGTSAALMRVRDQPTHM
ncbi:MAG: hypothetical protein E6447_02905 [Bradyrhizobium sp.]|nr:hypothetical protein [Bradyrhizobium sp.]